MQEYTLQKKHCCKDYNLKISTDKTKIMAFKGKHVVRCKIEIDGSILEQVKQFHQLGWELSLDVEPDFDKRIKRFRGTWGTIRKHLKRTRTDTQIKFYKVITRPTLWQRNMGNHEARHDSPRSCRDALSKKC